MSPVINSMTNQPDCLSFHSENPTYGKTSPIQAKQDGWLLCCQVSLPPKPMRAYLLSRFSSVQFSRSVLSDSLRPHELQHARPPCPSPTPGYIHINEPNIVSPYIYMYICTLCVYMYIYSMFFACNIYVYIGYLIFGKSAILSLPN